MLKRAGRYLRGCPRVPQLIPFQRGSRELRTFCDTDHAGCVRSRKSTTGSVILLGRAKLRSFCRGQSLIALSSGEAEFYGLVSAASESLGEQSILKDWGVHVHIRILMDATAGAAIGSRRGMGRVKHLNTIFLWVQDYVTSGRITIEKVHTSLNFADVLTKAVGGVQLRSAMEALYYQYLTGPSSMAFTA